MGTGEGRIRASHYAVHHLYVSGLRNSLGLLLCRQNILPMGQK